MGPHCTWDQRDICESSVVLGIGGALVKIGVLGGSEARGVAEQGQEGLGYGNVYQIVV